MPAEIRLWNVVGDSLSELRRARLDLEERSSLAFYGRFGSSHKAAFSLLPLDSSEPAGLRFIVYLHRLAELLGISTEQVEAALPESREPWK